ncbi:carboxylating nicotinate-nucleotide diphosphorylase [Methylotenera mobilis]|uniref:Probable nicotinate-nucleotide pyrophosphorylase [carboxylating] n=1 Tax=Methylotenera mobilis (strain JLW8 / ATCC BAA-1282 / DSM 17540) TaxID=583345 RepID=C6WUD1_METML|nr:carboxylating nicotinate-nucleotide diphosphorylase [Methylotenera mobilis]ACT47530.1 nicotinate-nucleotide pyrophosphorylase [Methylotenera mobilis JLW8]
MTQINQQHPYESSDFSRMVQTQVKNALDEDVGSGDLTAYLIPSAQTASAKVIVREAAVICGIAWFNECFKQIDASVTINWLVVEGEQAQPNQTLCTIQGLARSLLTAERCALNFLQTLSATATAARKYVDAIAGTSAQILDTRKTIPNLRLAQKYAVTIGGGHNQRLALYDGILIKENHIAAAGSIGNVMQQAFALNSGKSIQIEVEDLAQLQAALDAGASSILLDNFDTALLVKAVAINNAAQLKAVLEASGGITLDNVRAIAQTGVDRISIGAITKDIRAIDLSMQFTPNG